MKKLLVDLAELQVAFENYDGGLGVHAYWFDTQTGELILLAEDLAEQDALRKQIEEEAGERFVSIAPIPSYRGFRIMEDFVQTLPQSRTRERLEWSLNGPKPFRRFKDALYENKAARDRWHKFHNNALERYAIEWLAELGIEPQSGPPVKSYTGNEAGKPELGSITMTDLNPQAKQMAEESMVRTLDTQARAIWPQETQLVRRYSIPSDARILDAGCGTGEVASRLAELFPDAQVLGVDIIDDHLELARSRYADLAPRLTFEHQNAFGLNAPDHSFDLTVCRHLIHSIPHPERVISELVRVTRRSGYLHLIPEDYGMLHFQRGALDPRDFWHVAPEAFGSATQSDLFIGRNVFGILAGMNLEEITVDYVIVDTLRVPRETFAALIESWRDGYAEPIGKLTPISQESAVAYFDQMIASIRDPLGYAVWMVPVVSARVPASQRRMRASA
jgi:ubiquinone/menaquinone biosynthesis C-methylase UbiE